MSEESALLKVVDVRTETLIAVAPLFILGREGELPLPMSDDALTVKAYFLAVGFRILDPRIVVTRVNAPEDPSLGILVEVYPGRYGERNRSADWPEDRTPYERWHEGD